MVSAKLSVLAQPVLLWTDGWSWTWIAAPALCWFAFYVLTALGLGLAEIITELCLAIQRKIRQWW